MSSDFNRSLRAVLLLVVGVSCGLIPWAAGSAAAERQAKDATVHWVDSKLLDWVMYEPKTETLTAKFDSGGVYEYYRVPRTVFEALVESRNPGGYFNAYIRKKFTSKQLGI